MRPIEDSFLTPDERRSEVACILAAGVLRLCVRRTPATERSETNDIRADQPFSADVESRVVVDFLGRPALPFCKGQWW